MADWLALVDVRQVKAAPVTWTLSRGTVTWILWFVSMSNHPLEDILNAHDFVCLSVSTVLSL